MGRARIIHNYGEGLYAIEISYDVARMERERAKLERQIAELEPTMAGLAAAYDNARADYDECSAQLNVEIMVGTGTDAEKNRKIAELAKKQAELGKKMLLAGHNYDSARLKLLSLQSRLSDLNDLPRARNAEAWCADYSDELPIGATIGTIDIARAGFDEGRAQWILQPQYGKSTYYEPARDGMLQSTRAATAAAAYLNFALNPGLSKWLPRYRTATVTAVYVDSDTVDVEVHPARYARFDVNQGERLSRVPVQYMDVNAAVFEEGDDVVVLFRGNDWQDPVVIGFEHDPKLLPPMIVIMVGGYNKNWSWGFHHEAPYNGNWLVSAYEWYGGSDNPDEPIGVTYIIVLDPLTGELVQLEGGLSNPCRWQEFNRVYRDPTSTSRLNVTKPYFSATGSNYIVAVNDVVVRKQMPNVLWRFDHDFTPTIYQVAGKHDDWTIRPMTWTLASYSADCAVPNRSMGSDAMATDFHSMRVSSTVKKFYLNAWNAALLHRIDLDQWAKHDDGATSATYYEEKLGYSQEFSYLQTSASDNLHSVRLKIDTPHYADNPEMGEPFELTPLVFAHTYSRADRDDSSYTDEDNWTRDDEVVRTMEFQCNWQSPGGHQFSAPATIRAHERTYMVARHGELEDADYSAGFVANYTCGEYRVASACGPRDGSISIAFSYFRPLTINNTHDWDMVSSDPGWTNSFEHGETEVYVEVLWSPEQYAPLATLQRLTNIESIIKSVFETHIVYERNYEEWPDNYQYVEEAISKEYGTNMHECTLNVRFWRLHKR